MKILYISGREFGLVGTPGTYLVAEGYAQVTNFRMIAKPIIAQNSNIAHESRGNFPVMEIDFNEADSYERINKEILNFDPDCICVGGVRFGKNKTAISLAKEIKKGFSQLPLFLEIKSHLISPTILKKELKQELENNIHLWTGIIALNRAMAETWFGELKIPLLEHRIIIDYDGFNLKLFPEGNVKCNKFIFCGTVDKSRKFDDFIRLVDLLPADLKKKITIDIYGRGPNLSEHKALVEQLGLDRILQFKRGIPQKELLQRYEDYDAGIAWVPTDKKFNCAASLKLVEYCAAGLVPIVTSTVGHRLSTEDGRFNVRFFNPNFQSFEKEIRKAVMEGMDARLLQENVKLAAPFDFSSVVKNNILPFYWDNIKKPQTILETVTPLVIKNNEVVIINIALEAKNLPKLEKTRTDLVTFSSIDKVIDQWIALVKKRLKSKNRLRFRDFSIGNKIGKNLSALRDRLRTIIENQGIQETNQKALDELKKNLSHKERKNSFLEIELRKLLNKEIDKMTEIEFAKKEARFAITPARKISNGNEER